MAICSVAVCDDCGEHSEIGDNFNQVISDIKADGWKIYKDENGDWIHLCTSCR